MIGRITVRKDRNAGMYFIKLNNQMEYEFFAPDFSDKILVGDSVYKPAFSDTIRVFGDYGELAITFPKL